jgi:hypothetical protein
MHNRRDLGFITKFTVAKPICRKTELKWCIQLFRKRASQPTSSLPFRAGCTHTSGSQPPGLDEGLRIMVWDRGKGAVE